MNGNKLKTIKIIHFALLASVFLPIIITYANNRNLVFAIDFKNPYFQIGLGLALVALFTHKLIYKRAIENKFDLKSAKEKWNQYQTVHIIRMAILEGAAFANVGLVYLTGNFTHLIIGFALFIMMNEYHPNAKKIAAEWDLTEEEINEM